MAHPMQATLDERSARMKVVDPIASTGPSSPARVLKIDDGRMTLEFHHAVFPGSLIHVRTQTMIAFGRAEQCIATGSKFEITMEIVEKL